MVALLRHSTQSPPPEALTRFAPSESLSEQIFTHLADPAQSLLSVARAHNTSPHALSLWLSRPEISLRFASMRSAAAARTRWIAADHLPACAALASRAVHAALASPDLPTPDSALRAARLLLRLASFNPDSRTPSPKPRPTANPSPIASPTPSPTPSLISSSIPPPSDPSDSLVPSDFLAPSDSSDPSDPVVLSDPPSPDPSPSLDLPPGLLTALLPSFKHADRNPFLPEPGLLKTAPNQRALVKMRLKQQRKQVESEALHFLQQNNCCTESQFPLARREIEAFYQRGEAEPPSSSFPASRAPPLA